MRGYYEQLYSNKMENLVEMEKLWATYNLSSLNQEEMEKQDRAITGKDTESVIKNLPEK